MADSIVAGIALGRRGGVVMRAKVSAPSADRHVVEALASWQFEPASSWPALTLLDYQEVSWSPNDPDEAQYYISEMATLAARTGEELSWIGVSANGPFRTLSVGADEDGVLSSRADMPLQGMNLSKVIRSGLRRGGAPEGVKLVFQTDANACALGEALTCDLPENETLAFIYVAEGIGLGVVTGRRIHRHALHPELGLMPVRYLAGDHLRPDKDSNEYGMSLVGLASDRAMELKKNGTKPLAEVSNEKIWNERAYYLAQAALACTAILAPHRIVIGVQTEEGRKVGATADRVRDRFEAFLDVKNDEGDPVFEYSELGDLQHYITRSQQHPALIGIRQPLHGKAALGMCMHAALAERGRG